MSRRSLLAIQGSYPQSRVMEKLPERLSTAQPAINRWLRRMACLCTVALCVNSAAAQDSDDIREKTHQLEQLRNAGKFQEAVPIAEEILKYCEKNYGPDHPETADSLSDLAYLYGGMGDRAKALLLYQRALKIREKALGPDHPYTAIILNNIAETYRESGDFAKAEPLYKRQTSEHTFRAEQPRAALPRQGRFSEGGTAICASLENPGGNPWPRQSSGC
jgi:tetratricopeptide (TPR) repeat protein